MKMNFIKTFIAVIFSAVGSITAAPNCLLETGDYNSIRFHFQCVMNNKVIFFCFQDIRTDFNEKKRPAIVRDYEQSLFYYGELIEYIIFDLY